jgi:hypothetical protein
LESSTSEYLTSQQLELPMAKSLPFTCAVGCPSTAAEPLVSELQTESKKRSRRKCARGFIRQIKKQKKPASIDDTQCAGCSYRYGDVQDPLIGDAWEVCSKCKLWFHESCGNRKGRTKLFVCNSC